MKGDRELCTAAVAQNWQALQFVSQEMKGDRELCMAAVAQEGKALQWASEEMKGDRELCMAAVALDSFAIRYASKKIREDVDVVVKAAEELRSRIGRLSQGGDFWKLLTESLREDERVRQAAGF